MIAPVLNTPAVSPRADDANIVDVDLDSLTYDELLRERADVLDAISRISTQLMDNTRRPSGPEDDSPAWEAFRSWRRRARWALAFRRKELLDIKAVLHERNKANREARAARDAMICRQPSVGVLADQASRRARLEAELRETTPEALVARAYRVIRHLLTEGDDLPSTLDAHDRDTLGLMSVFMRARHGRALMAKIGSMEMQQ